MTNNLEKFFDNNFYCNKYQDILNSKYKDNALQHFKNIGYEEKREPCDFQYIDWEAYILDNNLKNDIYLAKIHFINKGIFNNNIIIKYNQLYEAIKNFDHEYYKNNNNDLKHLNKDKLLEHFINHGFKENRTYFNKNKIINKDIKINETINEIDKLINYEYDSNQNLYMFNQESYRKYNKDLSYLSDDELINHFINFGKNEKRIFCEPIKEFDYDYYLKNNSDIKINNISYLDINLYAWKHYLYHGYFEGKTYNAYHKNTYKINNNVTTVTTVTTVPTVPTVPTNNNVTTVTTVPVSKKTLVIYVYYNRPGEFKNETNLSFFINETIKKRDSVKDDIEFLFIINNYNTEVNIPIQKNINVLKNKNCMDFEAYLTGIRYIEYKYSNKIHNLYNYVMFMNCSCTGPFTTNNNFWLTPFFNKLNKYTVCCTSILTLITNNSYISGPQIPGYCFLLNSAYINLLIQTNNIFKNNKLFSKTVIGPKKNKYDCIISGEHCISIVLLNNNLNIAGICNENLDYRQKENYCFLKFNADRHPIFNYSLYKSIFIKNHWRIDDSNRDCHPVMWSHTKNEIENLSNMIFINYPSNLLNYNLLTINNTGIVRFNKSSWISKENFGNIFSDSEELIVFPNSNCTKSINYYYNVKYNNQNIQRYIIEAIKSLLYLNYRINFYTSVNKPFNFNIPNSINIIYTNKKQNNIIFNNENLGSDLLFPCTNFETFEKEMRDNKFEKSIIKIEDLINNKDKYQNNKYINFLTMYW